jgi:hypothetical protein
MRIWGKGRVSFKRKTDQPGRSSTLFGPYRFAISRFVPFSSRWPVGGRPYVVEEVYPLATTELKLW